MAAKECKPKSETQPENVRALRGESPSQLDQHLSTSYPVPRKKRNFTMLRKLTLLLLLTCIPAPSQDRPPPRSMVTPRDGIVATSHVQASVAGAQILAKGGSAIDAAIAANAVLGVTEPMMNGIGGDLFAIYWDAKTGKLYGLNSSGWAPQGLTVEHLKAKHLSEMPLYGIDSVTVPGAVAGWNALHERFGRLQWRELFAPAVSYTYYGYPVPEFIHGYWSDASDVLQQDPIARGLYLPNGKVPAIGDVFRNPDLGRALRLLALHGAADFYKGEVAQAILSTSQAL